MKIELTDPLSRWLLGSCALLTLIIVAEVLLPVADPTIGAGAAPAQSPVPEAATGNFQFPPRSHFAAVLERPIFFNDRKLPEPPPAQPPAPPQPLRLQLEGVAISGDSRVALLRSGNQLLQLAEGAQHGDWLLKTVTMKGTIFERDGKTTTLLLDPAKSKRR